MSRQRTLLLLLALAVLGALVSLLGLRPARPDVSLMSISRLAPGMTEADVTRLLGPPTDDLTHRPPPGVPSPAGGGRLLEYAGDRATAKVEFGPDGRLVRCRPSIRVVSGLERLRIRLNGW